jgi:Zn-dependent protease with chaperone function
MTYVLIGAGLALSSFVAIHAAVELAVAVLWRFARNHSEAVRPATYAAGLFLLRALPSVVAALVVGGAILPAFGRFEPRATQETMGAIILLTAGAGGAILVRTVWLAWQAHLATRSLTRSWMRSARTLHLPGTRWPAHRLDASFPVVAVVGTLRPRLFVSSAVLDSCTRAEVGAIVAHELGHITARDNLKALVFRCAPDLLSVTSAGRDLERAWKEAAEEAADDRAAARHSPLDLASALIKVARLAPAEFPPAVVASGLYRVEDLERRVRRLLRTDAVSPRRPRWLVAAQVLSVAQVGFVAAALWDVETLRRVHSLLEFLVEHLP